MITLDKQLKLLLSKGDISVAQLGRATGVPSKTIYGWTTGTAPKDINQVKKLASFFKVSLDSILFGEIDAQELQLFFPEINAGVYEVILRKVQITK